MATMARWFLLLLTGCSLTISGPDPNRPRTKPPTCETSKALVAIDGVLAATLGIVAIAAASSNDGGAAVAPALFGAAFAASAIHGNTTVNACHREMESYDAAVAAREIVPAAAPPEEERPQVQPQLALQPQPPQQPQPQLQPQLQPQPQPQLQPQPQPQPQPHTGDRWQAFWREVP